MTTVRQLIGNTRPYADIQKQIETARNSGDHDTANKLIKKLPKDMQTGMSYSGKARVDPVTKKIIIG